MILKMVKKSPTAEVENKVLSCLNLNYLDLHGDLLFDATRRQTFTHVFRQIYADI